MEAKNNHPLPLAKKHLGQNFLRNKSILDAIVGGSLEGKHIMEVGPGPGDLTAAILRKNPESVTVVEIDAEMIPLLEQRFDQEDISIYLGDVLCLDVVHGAVSKVSGIKHLDQKKPITLEDYQVYGNIPYYITSPIIHHFLYEVSHLPEKLIFTMQKEVADRILARDGKHSVLSVACQLVADIEKVCDINPQNFIPVPKVWSTCLNFHIKSGIDQKQMSRVLQVVKTGFAQKRKKLLSNLSNQYDSMKVKEAFQELGFDENVRAEDLSVTSWLDLSVILL